MILDATVVRCLLVPALMVLMGKVNWYMPRWLDRVVPHVSIEGAEFFAARDRPVGARAGARAGRLAARRSGGAVMRRARTRQRKVARAKPPGRSATRMVTVRVPARRA